ALVRHHVPDRIRGGLGAGAIPRTPAGIDLDGARHRRSHFLLRRGRHRRRAGRLVHFLRPRRDRGELAECLSHLGRRHVLPRRHARRARRHTAVCAREAQASGRRAGFPGAVAGRRFDGGTDRKFHQRRALGQADGLAVGVRRSERRGRADRETPVPAVRGDSRGPGAVPGAVVVHRQAASAAGAPRSIPGRLRLRALRGRVGAPAGCQYRISGGPVVDHGHAVDDAHDRRRRRGDDLRLPAPPAERQFERRQGLGSGAPTKVRQYLDFLRQIREHGARKDDRTGTGTLSVFGHQMRFDLDAGFPLVTTKQLHLRSIIYELLWFLRGETNIKFLHEHQVTIWDEWADESGNLGPVYGKQWRSWPTADGRSVDQLARVVEQIKTNPDSRRLVVSAWNVGELEQMALLPCHVLFQFYVAGGRLSCQLYQRSADALLGVPFNIASYALLTHMVAQQCALQAGEFIWTGGDCHLYLNHLEQADLQLSRTPYPLPRLAIRRKPPSLFEYAFEDFDIRDYRHHAAIKAPIAV